MLVRPLQPKNASTWERESRQAAAVTERFASNAGDAVGDRDIYEVAAVLEGIVSNADDAVGDRDTG